MMFASPRRVGALFLLGLAAACAPVAKPAPGAMPAAAPSVPVPPPPPRGEPQEFAGLPAAQLRGLLGEPAFSRKEGVGEIWRYDAADCHAFFFLFDAGGRPAVKHVETLPRGAASAADPACLNALRKTS